MKPKSFSFEGRARKEAFVSEVGFVVALYFGLIFSTIVLFVVLGSLNYALLGTIFLTAVPLLFSFVFIFFLIRLFATAVRRLHDIGRTGWWLLPTIPVAVSLVLFLVLPMIFVWGLEPLSLLFKLFVLSSMAYMISPPYSFILALILAMTPSKEGPNKYGPETAADNAISAN